MTPATSSSAPSSNGEMDMNDIDIEEGRRLVAKLRVIAVSAKEPITSTVLDAADAIETGRQWETIARMYWRSASHDKDCPNDGERFDVDVCTCGLARTFAAHYALIRDVADRTPTPTDGAS